MEIKISRKGTNDLLIKNKIRWTLFIRKNLFFFIFCAVFGAILLIGSAITQKDDGSFWGLGTSLGLSFMFLSIFYFLSTYNNKRKYIQRTKDYIKHYDSLDQNTEITFSDEEIKFKDFQSYYELKWLHFKNYMVFKDYLFINSHSQFLNSIIINKNEVSPEEFTELIGVVQKKLPKRK